MQPLNRCFVTYQEVKSLFSILYGTRNQKCVHECLGSLQEESVFKLLGGQPCPLSSFQLLLDHPLQPNVSIISDQLKLGSQCQFYIS